MGVFISGKSNEIVVMLGWPCDWIDRGEGLIRWKVLRQYFGGLPLLSLAFKSVAVSLVLVQATPGKRRI
jgi:hypothetical protein